MTKLEKIERAVTELTPEEMHAFADWFAELQSDLWDAQIERDALEGRLDKFGDVALAHLRAGRTTPL